MRDFSYLDGDRHVSLQELTKWRHTFKRLTREAQERLRGEESETAIDVLSPMIDRAHESRNFEYVRSDDPMEAARFVLSDAVAAGGRDEASAG